MSVNTLEFNQIATALNQIYREAGGQEDLLLNDTSQWVSCATKVLALGVDPVMGAITQILGRTIFVNRPYSRKFKDYEKSEQIWGAITRKIYLADKPFEDDPRLELLDGEAIDHYKVNKPLPLQMNFYGQNIFTKTITIFKDQLESSLQSPSQFAEFLAMVTQNASDMLEKAHEELMRGCVANYVGAKATLGGEHVVHLLTEYNEITALNLDAQTVMQPQNFKPFMQWVYSRIEEISSKMTERSNMFQVNVDGYDINLHTPREDQNILLYAPAKAQIDAMVLADTYHDNYLKLTNVESVNYWQAIKDPKKINVKPTYLNSDGSLIEGEAIEVDNVLGLITDRDAMGYVVMSTWTGVTPLNVLGGYWNQTYHCTDRYYNSFLEKGVLLLLD